MLQGDVHRLYRMLRRRFPTPPEGRIDTLDHVRTIYDYYAGMDPTERQLLLAWAKKEESGIGLIPAALSGVPLIGLMFAPFIQQSVRHVAPYAWVLLWAIGGTGFVAGVYVHHRQKAYTTLHISILEHLCRKDQQDLTGVYQPAPESELPLDALVPDPPSYPDFATHPLTPRHPAQ
jgi:hypothetical protein